MALLNIRQFRPDDVNSLLHLIQSLAVYEKAPNEVTNTAEQLLKDGFEENLFHAFVAELDNKIIGMALCYYRYSTWKGKCLYLEDLYVLDEYRGIGAGKALFDICVQFGKEQKCVRMNWQVLDWNQPAIDFYQRYGTHFDNEWVNCSISL